MGGDDRETNAQASKQSRIGSPVSRRSFLLAFLTLPVIVLDPEPAAAQFGGLLGAVLHGLTHGRGGYRYGHHSRGGERHYARHSRRVRHAHHARTRHARGHAHTRVAHHAGGQGGGHGGGGGGGGGMGSGGY
jgi:hypothetical protein